MKRETLVKSVCVLSSVKCMYVCVYNLYKRCPNKSARCKVRSIVVQLGWRHWKFNICHFCDIVVIERYKGGPAHANVTAYRNVGTLQVTHTIPSYELNRHPVPQGVRARARTRTHTHTHTHTLSLWQNRSRVRLRRRMQCKLMGVFTPQSVWNIHGVNFRVPKIIILYSDTLANEDNSFRNHIR